MGVFFGELWDVDHGLVESDPDGVGADITQTMTLAEGVRDTGSDARRAQDAIRQSLLQLFDRVQVLALPTLPIFPPRLDTVSAESLFGICIELTKHVVPFNVAGTPATAQPVPVRTGRVPASLQFVAPHHGEDLLVATAGHMESAVGSRLAR
jgi:Asp-tRNA(Asn)/Glu-tRNA(Gln) amidotransferase A subunit family amidase